MDAQISEFFTDLGRRGHVPLLQRVSGVVCFEVVDGSRLDRWLVTIDRGDVTVLHQGGKADCTIRADGTLFAGLCRGEQNAVAAILRGALRCTGSVELLMAIQRLFPGPRGTLHSEERGTP